MTLFFSDSLSSLSSRAKLSDFPAFVLTLTSCKCDIYLKQFNNESILWYILDTILSDFAQLSENITYKATEELLCIS